MLRARLDNVSARGSQSGPLSCDFGSGDVRARTRDDNVSGRAQARAPPQARLAALMTEGLDERTKLRRQSGPVQL
jgi:hypothetical protein